MQNLSRNAPIGVFDSGIGGLTVVRAIRKQLPEENLIYFGDTAHLPYGDKSGTSIRRYSLKISDLLLYRDCKAIVIACNTASSLAFKKVKQHLGKQALVFNVIDPATEYVCDNYDNCEVGVIGTKGTIGSRTYANRIKKGNHTLKVRSKSTPLLAPMIEEGFFNNNISRTIIQSYLNKKWCENMRAMILACTHYPLIKNEIREALENKIKLVDSAQCVSEKLYNELMKNDLHLKNNENPYERFYVSDLTNTFKESAKLYFGKKIELEELRIWDE
ncbi:MAG: glutamate racemase [Flavobacteriales bacterium]